MATKKSHIVGSADLTVTIAYADINGSNLVISDPASGEFKMKKIRVAANKKDMLFTYSSVAEA